MDEGISPLGIPTCKVNEMKLQVMHCLGGEMKNLASDWLGDGLTCELLKPRKEWQKGKLRLRLEFVPDEPSDNHESLDPLRKQLGTDQ
ncbi:hypothetical protein H6F82_01240 [Coleofasciculus sp. FACHB-SPT9]|nr:hypothetical protein [Coleofasciculus sp. FACHB-SPT9]